MKIIKAEEVKVNKEVEKYLASKKLAQLAYKRGLKTKKELLEFIDPAEYNPVNLEAFPKIKETAAFILKHLQNESRILIYGDYDVDGITSTSILVEALSKLSDQVSYHLPDRFQEGYGLNQAVLASYQDKIDLVISCDCGISNYKEVEFAKKAGVDFVITDHHDLPSKLPPADYILSPRFLAEDHQAYWLPGAGMAYFLVKAIYQQCEREGEEENFLDLLLLAIIADVVPLVGENRYLFKTGLKKLKYTERPGLKALYNELDIDSQNINEKTLGFQIGPLLNSAGRIDTAEKGLKLLLAENKREAAGLAAELKEINEERKKISQNIYYQLEAENSFQKRRGVIAYNSDWHQGVIGIAAGRITENYQLPAVLMTANQSGEITGSARSIEGININNLISQCSELLEKHGGHAAAAGFSLKKDQLEKFKLRLQRLIDDELKKLESELTVEADLNLDLADFDRDFYQSLRLFAPFGEANPEPLFYLEADILSSREISAGRHKRLILSDQDFKITALWWWAGDLAKNYRQQLLCRLTENIYRGNSSLQLEIKAVKALKKEFKTDKSSKLEPKKVIELVDWRDQEISQLEPGAEATIYFAEGLKNYNLYPLVDRDYYRKAEKLVLLTIPSSIEILTEIIILSEAEKLVLVDNKVEQISFEKFIKKLLALIKYTINKKNGVFDLKQAVIALNTEDLSLKRGLEYLRAAAFISFEYLSYHELLITKGGFKDQGNKNLAKKALVKMLAEANAFRRFLKNGELKELEKLINKSLN